MMRRDSPTMIPVCARETMVLAIATARGSITGVLIDAMIVHAQPS
jgi:hypothetical protein